MVLVKYHYDDPIYNSKNQVGTVPYDLILQFGIVMVVILVFNIMAIDSSL